MDTWTAKQKSIIAAGGNAKCKAFFDEEEISGMPLKEKYHTKAAANYRERIRATSEGRDPPAPPPKGTGKVTEWSSLNDKARSVSPSPPSGQNNAASAGSRAENGVGVANDVTRAPSTTGFGNPNFPQQPSRNGSQEGWSGSLSTWFSAATDAAGRVYQKAHDEGVWDVVKTGAQWVGEKGKTVVETARDESFWQNAGDTVQKSASVLQDKITGIKSSTSIWIDEHFGETQPSRGNKGDEAAAYLETLSTGKMDGFGPSSSNSEPVLSSLDSRGAGRSGLRSTDVPSSEQPQNAASSSVSEKSEQNDKAGSKQGPFEGLWDEEELQDWNPDDFKKKATVKKI